jgi:hypothetical protein
MITIAEVPEYIRQAEKLLTETERQERRGARDLLLSQRCDATVFAGLVCQE